MEATLLRTARPLAALVTIAMTAAIACAPSGFRGEVFDAGRSGNPAVLGFVEEDKTDEEEKREANDASALSEQFQILLEDVETNPYYTERSREILREQITTGFAAFDIYNGDEDIFEKGDDSKPKPELTNEGPGDLPLSEGIDGKFSVIPNFDFQSLTITDSYANTATVDCSGGVPCEYPDFFDLKSPQVLLAWQVSSQLAFTELQRYVFKQGTKRVRVSLGGLELAEGSVANPMEFYVYVALNGCDGDPNARCMYTVIERDAWYPAKPPWPVWNVKVELVEHQTLPVPFIEIDQYGNPIPIYSTDVIMVQRAASIFPKPSMQNFFAATIGSSILSQRCQSCHTLDTQAKLQSQHSSVGNVQSTPVASALTQGESVLHCANCHEQQLPYLGASSSFHEERWASPTPQLDINWQQIIQDNPMTWPTEVCNRMVTNMPTHAIRHEHFHEDSRLFWAVDKGELPFPGGGTLQTAFPQNYPLFLFTFDRWNDSGAYCP